MGECAGVVVVGVVVVVDVDDVVEPRLLAGASYFQPEEVLVVSQWDSLQQFLAEPIS